MPALTYFPPPHLHPHLHVVVGGCFDIHVNIDVVERSIDNMVESICTEEGKGKVDVTRVRRACVRLALH